MSAPDSIKALVEAMLPDETAMQAACRFLTERREAQRMLVDERHEKQRWGLQLDAALRGTKRKDEPLNDGRLDAVRALNAERDRLKGETRRLKREARRLSLAVESRNRVLSDVRAEAVESAAEKCKWWRDPVTCFVSDLKEHAQQLRNGGTDND